MSKLDYHCILPFQLTLQIVSCVQILWLLHQELSNYKANVWWKILKNSSFSWFSDFMTLPYPYHQLPLSHSGWDPDFPSLRGARTSNMCISELRRSCGINRNINISQKHARQWFRTSRDPWEQFKWHFGSTAYLFPNLSYPVPPPGEMLCLAIPIPELMK